MKKILSIIILIAMIFMLEFNLFKNMLPEAYVWFESILAFGLLFGLLAWNDFLKKTK
ncbi:MAG: hypothetical protein K9N05_06825 [Candidatus Marinimicrobia bacterium]|nr:hypothetical protein [Candidatus Neomarinimicrobiota bacterium]